MHGRTAQVAHRVHRRQAAPPGLFAMPPRRANLARSQLARESRRLAQHRRWKPWRLSKLYLRSRSVPPAPTRVRLRRGVGPCFPGGVSPTCKGKWRAVCLIATGASGTPSWASGKAEASSAGGRRRGREAPGMSLETWRCGGPPASDSDWVSGSGRPAPAWKTYGAGVPGDGGVRGPWLYPRSKALPSVGEEG